MSASTPASAWRRKAARLYQPSYARGGLYADDIRIRELLESGFTIESLTRVRSEAHPHGLCVARTRA